MQSNYSTYYLGRKQKNNEEVDEEFIKWIDKVEKIVFDKLNFRLLDLPDEEYVINYEKKMMPQKMAQIIITNFVNEFSFIY